MGTYRETILPDAPILYWPLTDSGTLIEDHSDHGRVGELKNSAALGGASVLVGDSDASLTLTEASKSYAKANPNYNPFSAKPEVRGIGAVSASTGALTPAYPAGVEAGDLALMIAESGGAAEAGEATPELTAAGWTKAVTEKKGNTRLTILYRILTTATDARTTNDTGDHQMARIVVIRKGTFNSANPINVSAVSTQAATKSGKCPGVTTTKANCLILNAISGQLPDTTTTAEFSVWANASLLAITEQGDNTTAEGDGGALSFATGPKQTAGVVSESTVTAVTEAERACATIAIEAAESLATEPIRTYELVARRASAHAQDDAFLSSEEAGTSFFYFYVKEGTSTIRLTLNGFGTTAEWASAWPGDEQTVHIALVVNPITLKATLYVNGVSKGEKTISAYGPSPGNLRLGHDGTSGGVNGAWAGRFGHLAIYNGALSAERIAAHSAAALNAPAARAPGCYWGMAADGDAYPGTRINLCPYPSFEAVGLPGWTKNDAATVSLTATRSLEKFQSGTASLKLVNTTAGEDDAMILLLSGLLPSTTYTISAYCEQSGFVAGALSNRGLLVAGPGTGNPSTTITEAKAGWTRHSVTFTGNAETGNIEVRLYAPKGTVFWDSVLIEQTAELKPYFGATETGWLGAVNESVSYLTGAPDFPYVALPGDKFEEHAGRKGGIVHFADPWPLKWDGFGDGHTPSERVHERGAIVMKTIGLDSPGILAKILAGTEDAAIVKWAYEARAFGHPMFLRPFWEANGDWYAWGRSSEYVAAWRYLHRIISAVAKNVSFVYCPNVIYDGPSGEYLTSMFPGTDVVDWMGMDGYSSASPIKNVGWKTGRTLYKATYEALQALHPTAPVMICESAASETGGSKPVWLRNLLDHALPEDFPRVKAYVYFNWNIIEQPANERIDWPIESTEASTAAYKAGSANPYYAAPSAASLLSGAKVPEPGGEQVFAAKPERVSDLAAPKLAVPLRLSGTGFAAVEQGSVDEVAACVYAQIATPRGSRIEEQDFGVEEATFRPLPLDVSEWLEQIKTWEPRAEIETAQQIEDTIDLIELKVGSS